MGDAVNAFLDMADRGSIFVFGEAFRDHFIVFKVLPTIIFFSSFITVLYYLGVMQRVVQVFAWVTMRLMRTSGAESLSAAANIFVGHTEAPLLIRPYMKSLTRSELMAVMTGGFVTIAGGVMVVYVGILAPRFPDIAGHLIAASVMGAPAGLVMSKLMLPETEQSLTAGTVRLEVERPWSNVIDAAAEGATTGLDLGAQRRRDAARLHEPARSDQRRAGMGRRAGGVPAAHHRGHPRLGVPSAGLGARRRVGGVRPMSAR